tara:strand:+ start:689 stop:892 length:204 start_codon:yes stop_codon:yes gene_type:complete
MRYSKARNNKYDKDYVRFDYNIPEGNKYRDVVNKKINTTIRAMYFKTPSNPIEWIVTFFKCIVRGIR